MCVYLLHVLQGMPAAVCQRLPSFRFTSQTVKVKPEESPSHYPTRVNTDNLNHTTALQNTLRQLGDSLQATNRPVLYFSGWQWQQDSVVQTLAAAIPTLPQFRFGIGTGEALTDGLLDAVIAMGPQLCRVSVGSLSLQSDAHANTPWPWEELSVSTLDLGQVSRLPQTTVSCGRPARKVEVRSLHLSSDITQVGV